MKSTENFKRVIQQHLNSAAELNPLFAERLKNPKKNIDDCINYILNQVQKSGCQGFEDTEIFGMAMHYYDEDEIQPGKKISGKVIVNHEVKLTQEEIDEARERAKAKVMQDEINRITKKNKKPTEKKGDSEDGSLSLFK